MSYVDFLTKDSSGHRGFVFVFHSLIVTDANLEAAEAIRVSLGWNTTVNDIERFFAAWGDLYDKTQRRASAA